MTGSEVASRSDNHEVRSVMMGRLDRTRYRIGGLAAVLGASVLVAACGSSSTVSSASSAASGSASTQTGTSGAAATATPTSARAVSIGTASGKDGTYLTGASGRALYLWVADSGAMSSCSGKCAVAWPPLTTKGKPVAGKGVQSADLGTIKRSDGSMQVTYQDHPLYYFIEDKTAGSLKGQGSDAFGADWWLVAPSGAAIHKGDPDADSGGDSDASSDSSSSGSSGGGGG
jgi:predicted lipoprotein with Yx(FWY)xxD motif